MKARGECMRSMCEREDGEGRGDVSCEGVRGVRGVLQQLNR